MTSYVVDKAALAVLGVAAKDAVRPPLYGVFLRDGKAHAADGFMAAMADLPDEDESAAESGQAGVLVDRKTAQETARLIGRHGTATVEPGIGDGDDALVTVGGATLRAKQIDRTFPDIAQIVPTSPVKGSIFVDPEYLMAVAKAAKDFGCAGVRIDIREHGNAVVFSGKQSDGDRRITLLLMPRLARPDDYPPGYIDERDVEPQSQI